MNSGLWEDYPATDKQTRLSFSSRKRRNGGMTQADIILDLLRIAKSENRPLRLPEILGTHIAQFTARIYELRKRGFTIENEMQRGPGTVRSSYRLIFDPEGDAQ